MKILLIQSYTSGPLNIVYPIGLVNLGTVLKNERHHVAICDLNLLGESYMTRISNMIHKFVPDVIGLSIRNIDSTHESKIKFYYEYIPALIKLLKKANTTAVLVAGGSGFSLFAKEIMQENPEIDYGIIGEGEQTLLRLLISFDDMDSLENICYRKGSEVVFTKRNYKNEIFEYLSPDYSLLSPGKYYKKGEYSIGIETKRGCNMRCAYCSYPFLNGTQFRFRKTELILEDIKRLYHDYGIESFTFIDSVFNKPVKYSTELVQKIKGMNLPVKWSAWFSEQGFTREYAQLCHSAGCNFFTFSPDGFSKETLIALKKGIKTSEIVKIPDIMKDFKEVSVIINFFRFPPRQTITGFISLLMFYVKTKFTLKGKLKGIGLNRIRIEPHTDICRRAVSEGIINKDYSLLYPVFYKNSGMTIFERAFNLMLAIKNFIKDAFKK